MYLIMKVSVVISYYNRRDLFIKTLQSISNTQFKGEFEIIVVDDASIKPQHIDDLPELFPKLNLKVMQIDKKDKWWINPCIPNNIGFEIASGDVIIIQNPECLHMGDIISYAAENIGINKYIVFGCYAVDYDKTAQISRITGSDILTINGIIQPTNDMLLDQCPYMDRWYQHSEYSPRGLNFCTTITKQDLEDLGGFDELYAYGQCYDDAEFVRRIRRKGMYVDMIDSPFVVHQCHGYGSHNDMNLVNLNNNLFDGTANSEDFRVINKHTKSLVERIDRKQ